MIRKLFNKYSVEIKIISALLLISIIVYRVWFSFSIFVYGDGVFFFKEALKDFVIPSAWGWQGGAVFWHYPFSFIYGLFGVLGLGTNIAEKFMIFWPIIFLGPLAGFLLVKKITNSNLAGFIGSIIFTYNTYFLSINTQSHILLPLAFIFSTFAFLSFINVFEDKNKYLIPITSLLLFVTGVIDMRSLYVVTGIIFLYFIYNQILLEKNIRKTLRQNLIKFISVFFLLLLLNLYWLIPSFATASLTSNEFLNRAIFGSQFYTLQSSIAFFYPYWTGKETTWLYVQKIPIYFWLYPVLAFAGLISSRKNKKILFFGLIALLGIFLSKQEASPFGFLYTLMFSHIPGFAAFREASKFDYLILISYAVLIGAFADFAWKHFKNKNIKYILIFFLIFLPLWNSKPYITGEIKTMFVPISVPQNFVELKNFIFKDQSYSKIIGVSLNGKYLFSTYVHPEYDLLYSLVHYWGEDVDGYKTEDKSVVEGEKLMNFLATDKGRRLLSMSSVGYVSVFIEDKPTFQSMLRDLGTNSDYVQKRMDKLSYLKKINLNLNNIILYKTLNSKPHLYLTREQETLSKDIAYSNINFKMVSPSEYKLSFKSFNNPAYLNFTELYDPTWGLHVGRFSWFDALFKKDYFLPNSIHSQTVARFNQFYLDPKVCGSDNCQLTLYYKPQSYLYLGLIISGITLGGTVIVTIYLFKKEKNEKRKS